MPRILNAKQTSGASANSNGIPPAGQYFILANAYHNRSITPWDNGILRTPPRPIIGDTWTVVPTSEEGVYQIRHGDYFVVEGHRPDPVRVGSDEEEPVTVRIIRAGGDTYVIKAPNEDLVWTFIPEGVFGEVQYKEPYGSTTQLWRFRTSYGHF